MVWVNVSTGDALDKMSILEIKLDKIKDTKKQNHVIHELEQLSSLCVKYIHQCPNVYLDLKDVNLMLWDLENVVRNPSISEEEFLEASRKIFSLNTERAALKLSINKVTGSDIFEVKEHAS